MPVAIIAAPGVASAATGGYFTTLLTGTQEVPANASPGTGLGTVTLSADETQITVNATFSGLVAPATASHIHGPAAPGVNAPPLFPLAGVPAATSGTIPEQTFPITAAQVADLKAGLYYLNIHSSTFPGGEIRGQLTADADQPAGLDHFACHNATQLPAGPAFTPPAEVGLADQFGNDPHVAVAPVPERLCNPAVKMLPSGEVFGVQNPDAHLVCWQIQRSVVPATHTVNVKNQFGTATLTTFDAERLCLPSWKWLVGDAPPNMTTPAPPGLDHFECYRVNDTAAAQGFVNKPPFVLVSDEFGNQRHLNLGPVEQLCNPVTKTVAPGQVFPAQNTDAHLVCFAVTPDPPVNNVTVNASNQFGQGTLAATGPTPLCLPSFKSEIPPPDVPEMRWVVGLSLSALALAAVTLGWGRRRLRAA